MRDWNWFFSSLSQSVAALVGVTAAFLIARLVNSQAEFRHARARTEELLNAAARLADAANARYFEWYIDHKLQDALREVRDIRSTVVDDPPSTPEEFAAAIRFPIYMARPDVVKAIQGKLAELEEREREKEEAAAEKALRRHYGISYGIGGLGFDLPIPPMPHMKGMSELLSDNTVEQELNAEGDLIAQLHVEVRHNIRQIERHLTAIGGNPEQSSLVRIAIAACSLLFFTGIIYPLSFLPADAKRAPALDGVGALIDTLLSLRGALLVMVSIVFSALLIALYRANEVLTHPPDDLAKLEAATQFSFYSVYLEIAEENKRIVVSEKTESESSLS
jgi:fumarate reductase subunit D